MSLRLPPWIKVRIRVSEQSCAVNNAIKSGALNTVCESAHCPNRQECFSCGTATFMILGDICTRNCRFCAIQHGTPLKPDHTEPERIAGTVVQLGMRHVVLTSVTRDDLPDGGASHFAETIKKIKNRCDATIEVLTPDFKANAQDIATVLKAGPDVFNHNVETVKSLQAKIRPQAGYETSLKVLKTAADSSPALLVKSGLMVGLGETDSELFKTFQDLINAGCKLLTIGQYLAPSREHEPVQNFVLPEKFEFYEKTALDMGFKAVASGPLVRSSYNALEMLAAARSETPEPERYKCRRGCNC